MARDRNEFSTKEKAHAVFIRLVFPAYTVHFKSGTYMQDATLEMLDKRVSKEVLRSTAQPEIREVIGTDEKYWSDFCTLLKAAIPSLERRSFTIWDPSSVDYESTSGALIASHYPGLWKDLERLNDLVSIARNVLTVGDRVQDLAAQHSLDSEIFRLINCCVRVTARGYDGDAGTGDEEKWQWVVNAYKKLLITSLQFLNNFVAKNERRKLMLWVALFDNSSETVLAPEDVPETSSASLTDVPSNPSSKPAHPLSTEDFLVAYGIDQHGNIIDTGNAVPLYENISFADYPLPKEAIEGREQLSRKEKFMGNGYGLFVKRLKELQAEDYQVERKRDPTLAEAHLEFPRRWAELNNEDHEYWQGLFDDAMAKYRQDLAVYEAKMIAVTETQPVLRSDVPVAEQTRQVERKIAMLEEQLAEKYKSERSNVGPLEAPSYGRDGHLTFDSESLQSRPVVADDMRMLFTAEAGTKILESGKAELMKRLEGYEVPSPSDPNLSSRPPGGATATSVQPDEFDNQPEMTRSTTQTPPPRRSSQSRGQADLREQRSREQQREESRRRQQQDEEEEEQKHQQSQGTDTIEQAFEESVEEEEEEEDDSEEAEEDEEEDYPGSTEDGRGLLTDVPLILGTIRN